MPSDSSVKMRPIFCGNFDYDARPSDLERLFRRYGRVDRVDMKSGFAFVYMDDEKDGEHAIRALDHLEFGRKGRRLRVEWTREERGVRRPVASRRHSANSRPSKTLFIINFDPHTTRIKDLEKHFEPYGRIQNVRIRRNFAFVHYELQEDATRALEATHNSKFIGRFITVEYAVRDDDERRNGFDPERVRDRSSERSGYDRRPSPSPYKKMRGSPDYGHGPSSSFYQRERADVDYGHRRASPSPYARERPSPDYGRRRSSPAPRYRDKNSPEFAREMSRSPYPRERASLENPPLGARGSPYYQQRSGDAKESPFLRERSGSLNDDPYQRDGATPNSNHNLDASCPFEAGRVSPKVDHCPSHSPSENERPSPDHAHPPAHSNYFNRDQDSPTGSPLPARYAS